MHKIKLMCYGHCHCDITSCDRTVCACGLPYVMVQSCTATDQCPPQHKSICAMFVLHATSNNAYMGIMQRLLVLQLTLRIIQLASAKGRWWGWWRDVWYRLNNFSWGHGTALDFLDAELCFGDHFIATVMYFVHFRYLLFSVLLF
jgi:hypothetical protein